MRRCGLNATFRTRLQRCDGDWWPLWQRRSRVAHAALLATDTQICDTVRLGVYLFFNDRRQFKFFGLSFLSGLLSMAILGFCLWGKGFYWSTFVVPSVSFSWSNYWRVPALVFKQWLYLGFAVLCLYSLFHDLKHRRLLHVTGCYFAMSIVVLLATLGKEGASTNFFFEPTLAGLLYPDKRRMFPRGDMLQAAN